MPHEVIIILGRTGAMKGNATTGKVVDLEAAVNGVQGIIDNGEPTNIEAMHDKMHELQDWLVDGGLTVNPVDTIETFTTELNALL
jgi:hypothetical protein